MSTILTAGLTFLGVLFYLFFIWKRLKEDYLPSRIFSASFIILAGAAVGIILNYFLIAPLLRSTPIFSPNGTWFWFAFIGAALGLAGVVFKYKMRFFETMEAVALGFAFLVFFAFMPSIISLVLVVLLGLFFFLDSRYKRFSWYKSGKVGFSGLALLALFFLIRAFIAMINPDMVSFTGTTLFIGKVDAVISSILSFIFFLTLYNLSQRV